MEGADRLRAFFLEAGLLRNSIGRYDDVGGKGKIVKSTQLVPFVSRKVAAVPSNVEWLLSE